MEDIKIIPNYETVTAEEIQQGVKELKEMGFKFKNGMVIGKHKKALKIYMEILELEEKKELLEDLIMHDGVEHFGEIHEMVKTSATLSKSNEIIQEHDKNIIKLEKQMNYVLRGQNGQTR